MFIIRADTALLPDGWQNNVYVHINSLGKIDRVTTSLESSVGQRMSAICCQRPSTPTATPFNGHGRPDRASRQQQG